MYSVASTRRNHLYFCLEVSISAGDVVDSRNRRSPFATGCEPPVVAAALKAVGMGHVHPRLTVSRKPTGGPQSSFLQ